MHVKEILLYISHLILSNAVRHISVIDVKKIFSKFLPGYDEHYSKNELNGIERTNACLNISKPKGK
jgi:hypothetical protein